uniref:Uncharacterized protein n=1 Tax=Catagonus wagneri TaxID=51154 RepID=A0A8C3VUN2_9CETA
RRAPPLQDGGADPAAEASPLACFMCLVSLEVYEKSVQVSRRCVFYSACLQEPLTPKKPVCGGSCWGECSGFNMVWCLKF